MSLKEVDGTPLASRRRARFRKIPGSRAKPTVYVILRTRIQNLEAGYAGCIPLFFPLPPCLLLLVPSVKRSPAQETMR